MEKFQAIRSKIVPLPMTDVDTDLIIPAQFLTSISREGYGQNLFRRLKDADSKFPLNRQEYSGAKILITDSNFGCGSSREHAVWALTGAGFRVVIGKSFADIFYNNSAKNGLLLITLPASVVDALLEAGNSPEYEVFVDLSSQVVTLPTGEKYTFDFDPFRKHCLLEGLDDIDYIMSKREEIAAFRATREATRFFQVTPAAK